MTQRRVRRYSIADKNALLSALGDHPNEPYSASELTESTGGAPKGVPKGQVRGHLSGEANVQTNKEKGKTYYRIVK